MTATTESCLIIAGEKSGEEHASSFLPEVIKNSPHINFFGVGGEYFENLGVDLLYHFKDFSSWGYSEVITKIPFYLNSLKVIESKCEELNCKYAILIDFQEFNLKLAKKLSQKGIKIYYYVAPQAWAWKSWRSKTLAKYVDSLFTILPFEEKWFKDRGVANVYSIPHPVYSRFKSINYNRNKTKNIKHTIGIFPGSRNSEIKNLLPIFLKSAILLSKSLNCKFVIVYPDHIERKSLITLESSIDLKIVTNDQLDEYLPKLDYAMAASGTINLNLALYKIPTIVCYKTSLLNQFIYETFVDYPGPFSLPNIIWNKIVFPELMQDNFSEYNIVSILRNWIKYNSDGQLFYPSFNELTLKLSKANFDVSGFLIKEMSKPNE